MDGLDMRLLRAIGTTPFEHGARPLSSIRPAQLAKAVGTTRQTAEARLAKMEEQGILVGYQLYPNLRLLPADHGVYHFRAQDLHGAARAYDALDLTGGVAGKYRFMSADMCVRLYWTTPQEHDALLRRLSGLLDGCRPLTLYQREMPRTDVELTTLDWRILAELRQDARRLPEELAAALGVSARTVRRRIQRMEKHHAFDVAAVVAPDKFTHTVPIDSLFRLKPEAGRRAIAELGRTFDDRCLMSWVPPAAALGDYAMSLFAESLREVEEMRQRALTVPGVAEALFLLPTGAAEDPAWLDQAMARRLATANA